MASARHGLFLLSHSLIQREKAFDGGVRAWMGFELFGAGGQRRILFRSWHRGMREMDLVLGRFADAEIASLCETELDDYELLLEAQDRDVFSWLTLEAETPSSYDTPVLRKIRAFHSHGGPIHT
jgi:antitoxin CptB